MLWINVIYKRDFFFWCIVDKMSRSMANATEQKVQGGERSSSQGPGGKKGEKEGSLLRRSHENPALTKRS